MAAEFGGVHAFDARHAGLVFAAELDPCRVLENVSTGAEEVDEEMARRVAGRFVVAKAILVTVAREDVHRFGAAAAVIAEVDVFEVAVAFEDDANDEFVTDLGLGLSPFADPLEDRACVADPFEVELFGQLERRRFIGSDLADVLEVLPMDAPPSDPGSAFLAVTRARLGWI